MQDELRRMTDAYNKEKNLQGDNQRTIVGASQIGCRGLICPDTSIGGKSTT
jgi:hypothetical protein